MSTQETTSAKPSPQKARHVAPAANVTPIRMPSGVRQSPVTTKQAIVSATRYVRITPT